MRPLTRMRKTRTTTAVMATPATIMRMIIITTMIMAIITITAVTITTTSIASTSIITAIPMLMTTNRSEPDDAPPALSESETAALYRLMTWLSPSFPVGGFSYSSGIEWAVEAGDITEAASLRAWLASMLADGPGFCDGVFLAHVHRAAEFGNDAGLRDIVELAAAFVGSRERQL